MEEKNKETINISLKTAIILIIITILIVGVIVYGYGYFLKKAKNQEKVNVEETKTTNVVKENKEEKEEKELEEEIKKEEINDVKTYNKDEIVSNADYKNDLDKTSYKTLGDDTYSVKDIIVPYIKMESKEIEKINTEIKAIYQDLVLKFKGFANEEETMGYVKSSYDTYLNDNVLSVVLTIEEGETYLPIYTYYTYNIDLSTLKQLSYAEVCDKFNYENTKIENKLKEIISTQEEIEGLDDESKTNSINRSIDYYKKEKENNTLNYYIDDNKKINIVIKLENEEISPSTFFKIINI